MDLDLPPEAEMFLTEKLKEGKLSLREIKTAFNVMYPYLNIKLKDKDLKNLAENIMGGEWKEKPEEELSETVEKEIKKAIIDEEIVSDGEKKIDQTKRHRQVLKEAWENYQRIKWDKNAELAKAKWLDTVSKELVLLETLEEAEKGIQAQMAEIRAKEEEESAEDMLDYIYGYSLQILLMKAKTFEKGKELFKILQEKINIFLGLIEENEKEILEEKKKNIEEIIRDYLEKLYSKKVF